jgi:RND family efflux transporter MFP subunit
MQNKWNKISVVSAAFLCLSACSEAPESREQRAVAAVPGIPVIAEPLAFEPARTRIEAVGTSRAMLSAELYPAASGEVVAVNFEPGQRVTKGEVLVELDSREQLLAVRLAKLKLEDAERLYDRYSRSAASGAVLPTTLDAARTAMELARVELESAKIDLADRSIRAVFDGHVGTTDVDPGDRINPNTLVTTLDDRQALLVSFDVPEAFIGELAVGDTVGLETWSGALPPATGEIVDVGSRIDPSTRSFVARARVANDDDSLRPGMGFKVQADVIGETYAAVAETGVQWGADGAYIWAAVNGQAERVPVQVIQRRDGRVLIDGDLREDELVVVEGTQSVRDGAVLNVDEERLAKARGWRTNGGGGGEISALD